MIISIIDDQPEIRYSVSKILRKEKHITHQFTGEEDNIIKLIIDSNSDLIVLDVMLKFEKSGIDLLEEFRNKSLKIPVVLMTAFTTPKNVIKATKLGVIEILQKPFEQEELLLILEKITNINKAETQGKIHHLKQNKNEFIGSFETMKEIYKKIGIAANNDLNVLITGDTGTGKELVANLIHENSAKVNEPFVAINCASIPNELFESQLFGHEKGSFTGATNIHIGYAQQVGKGTLFLDEIGEIDINLQTKLLRFLENKIFRKIGGNDDISFEGRIVAATNINFKSSINNMKFREDLYYRLSMLNISLPSLNERRADIPLLVDHFILLANKDLKTSIKSISKLALNTLENYDWTGNIRQLKNIIYNCVLNSNQEVISLHDIKFIEDCNASNIPNIKTNIQNIINEKGIENIQNIKNDIEKDIYEIAVEKSQNLTQLANYLNTSRSTLRKKLQTLNINYKEQN